MEQGGRDLVERALRALGGEELEAFHPDLAFEKGGLGGVSEGGDEFSRLGET